jgi:hypothetical protein
LRNGRFLQPYLIVLGELTIGIGLTLGFLTAIAAIYRGPMVVEQIDSYLADTIPDQG